MNKDHNYLGEEKLIKPTFLLCLFKVFYGKFMVANILRFIHELFVFLIPLLIE